MRDAHSHLHGNSNTPTYSRGTKKIDYILVSKTLISTNALVRAGTLPLHQGITSNHTLLFINFKEKRLLRASSSKIMSIQSRILSSKNKRSRTKYCHHFLKQKNQRKYWRHGDVLHAMLHHTQDDYPSANLPNTTVSTNHLIPQQSMPKRNVENYDLDTHPLPPYEKQLTHLDTTKNALKIIRQKHQHPTH